MGVSWKNIFLMLISWLTLREYRSQGYAPALASEELAQQIPTGNPTVELERRKLRFWIAMTILLCLLTLKFDTAIMAETDISVNCIDKTINPHLRWIFEKTVKCKAINLCECSWKRHQCSNSDDPVPLV